MSISLLSNKNEWDKLAKWIVKNELFSDNVRWLIQIPRLYDAFKKSGAVDTFEEVVQSECSVNERESHCMVC